MIFGTLADSSSVRNSTEDGHSVLRVGPPASKLRLPHTHGILTEFDQLQRAFDGFELSGTLQSADFLDSILATSLDPRG